MHRQLMVVQCLYTVLYVEQIFLYTTELPNA